MSKYKKPIISPDEQVFEVVSGNSRFLQPKYLSRHDKVRYDATYDLAVEKLGRKVNKSLIYTRTMTNS